MLEPVGAEKFCFALASVAKMTITRSRGSRLGFSLAGLLTSPMSDM